MDVAADLIAEFAIVIVALDDRMRVGAVEQFDRAAREDAAVAAQIRLPFLVGDFVREDLGDVDRGRVERLDQQAGGAREILVVMRFRIGAIGLDPGFDRGRGLGDRDDLARQPLGSELRRLDRLFGCGADRGDLFLADIGQRGAHRACRAFAHALRHARDRGGEGVARLIGGERGVVAH